MPEPIEIIIRQGGQGGLGFGGGNGSAGVSAGSESGSRGSRTGLLSGSMEPGESLLKKMGLMDHMFVDFAKSQIKKTINFGVAQYGNLTGDYIGQRNINNALRVAGDIGGIVMGAVSGAKFGPAGAVAGAVIATASIGINMGMEFYSYQTDIKKQNIQAEFMRERAGSTLGSGSRGTYE